MLFALPASAFSTTYTFTQTSWSGGITANTPNHTDNRTGWTEYSATSTSMGVVNAGADLQIATSTTSVTQTNDGSTNTGFNLAGKTFSDTEVLGDSGNASVYLASTQVLGGVNEVIDDNDYSLASPGGAELGLVVDSGDKLHALYLANGTGVVYDRIVYATNTSGSWVPGVATTSYITAMDIAVALDQNDKIHATYRDGAADAYYVTNASGSWVFTNVDSGDGVATTDGQYSDIAVDGNGAVHISYQGGKNGSSQDLEYATNASGSWATTTLDNANNMGTHTSVVTDSANKVHITYYNATSAHLKYATNASGSWATSTIDSSGLVGQYGALAIGADDKLHVVYYGTTNIIRYGTKTSGGNWATSTVLTGVESPTIDQIHLALDSQSKAHIVYPYWTGGDLMYATNASGSWASSTVVSTGTVGRYSDIAIGSDDVVHIAYDDTTNTRIMHLTEAPTYASTGTYTSGPISLGAAHHGWHTLSWSETPNGGTITIKARSDADGDFSNATDWGSCANITNGAALSTGNCVNDDHPYIQYQATLSTPDTSTTPILSDVTIGYVTYVTGQTLTSSIFDTQSTTTAIDFISWIEEATLPANASLIVQLRTAETAEDIASGSWYSFNSVTVNCTKTDDTVTCPSDALPLAIKNVSDDNFFQYRVTLSTDDGADTPTFSEVSIGYTPDAGIGPTVDTQDPTALTATTATLNGTITGTGGTDVTVRGFAYGTDSTFVTVIATTTDTAGQPFSTGAFTHNLTGLTCGIAYYVRAYATNTAGTGFGFDEAFTLPCESSSGGGAPRERGEGGEAGPTPTPSDTDPGPGEEDPFRLPVFDHTGPDRRFDPAGGDEEPYTEDPIPPTPEPPPDDGGGDSPPPILTRTVRSIQTVAKETTALIASTTEQVAPIAISLGALTGTFTLAGTAIPLTGGGSLLIALARLWHLLLSALGLRKRKPWGVVYDSVTKHPLDPAVIRLTDEYGKALETGYTDFEGRYGFLIPPGTYRIEVSKQNYIFPSKRLQGKLTDGLYTNLYFGGPLTTLADGALIHNIPLDPVGLDWKEFNAQSSKSFHFYSELDRLIHFVFRWFFRLGFLAALYTLATTPSVANASITTLYALIGALRLLGFGPRPYGYLTDHEGTPLSFALVTIRDAKTHREITKTIADHHGRYHALVPNGEYVLEIARKEEGAEEYQTIYTSEPIRARRGIIREGVRV